jgi:nucleotide-binding universal stress UspA family protein
MTPIRKILVPNDFSEHSKHALGYAADLAQSYSAAITLVHVFPIVNYAAAEGFTLYTPEQLTAVRNDLEARLMADLTELRALGVSEVERVVVQGDPSRELIALAPGFDMIVMGTHGRGGVKHVLLGSVTERIVRSVTCPVLTVR